MECEDSMHAILELVIPNEKENKILSTIYPNVIILVILMIYIETCQIEQQYTVNKYIS